LSQYYKNLDLTLKLEGAGRRYALCTPLRKRNVLSVYTLLQAARRRARSRRRNSPAGLVLLLREDDNASSSPATSVRSCSTR
jgi:hypothetical protein